MGNNAITATGLNAENVGDKLNTMLDAIDTDALDHIEVGEDAWRTLHDADFVGDAAYEDTADGEEVEIDVSGLPVSVRYKPQSGYGIVPFDADYVEM